MLIIFHTILSNQKAGVFASIGLVLLVRLIIEGDIRIPLSTLFLVVCNVGYRLHWGSKIATNNPIYHPIYVTSTENGMYSRI